MKQFTFTKQKIILSIILVVLILLPVLYFINKNHSDTKVYYETQSVQANIISKDNVSEAKDSQSTEQDKGSQNTGNNVNVDNTKIQASNSYTGTEDSVAAFVKEKIVVYSGSAAKMQVALTFDDGPDNKYTPKILDILKQNDIKATFFVVGKNVKLYPNMLKRISSEGHAIGSHTFSHVDLNKLNSDDVRAEMINNENAIDAVLGSHLKIMRPPYGLNSVQTIKPIAEMGYKVIDWSVDTVDWAGTAPSKIMDNVSTQTKPGAIILHHCAPGKAGLDNTISVLPTEISTLKSKGYQFVTVPELLNLNN